MLFVGRQENVLVLVLLSVVVNGFTFGPKICPRPGSILHGSSLVRIASPSPLPLPLPPLYSSSTASSETSTFVNDTFAEATGEIATTIDKQEEEEEVVVKEGNDEDEDDEEDDDEGDWVFEEYDRLVVQDLIGSEWRVGSLYDARRYNPDFNIYETWVRLLEFPQKKNWFQNDIVKKNVAVWGDGSKGTWDFDYSAQYLVITKTSFRNYKGTVQYACSLNDYYYLSGQIMGYNLLNPAGLYGRWQASRLGQDPEIMGEAPWANYGKGEEGVREDLVSSKELAREATDFRPEDGFFSILFFGNKKQKEAMWALFNSDRKALTMTPDEEQQQQLEEEEAGKEEESKKETQKDKNGWFGLW